MSKWIAEFELEDGDTMPEHMDLNYMGARIDFHCRPLEQYPCVDTDIRLIHTQGLDEGIRCAMCTNSMANDRGCDGECVVNDRMYKRVMKRIEDNLVEQEPKTDVLDKIKAEIAEHAYPVRYGHNSIEKGMTLTGINQVIDKYRKEGK